MQACLAVLVHQVTPAHWPACRRLLGAVQDACLDACLAPPRLTWLLAPSVLHGPGDAGFEAELTGRLQAGDEIALQLGEPPSTQAGFRRRRTASAQQRQPRCEDALAWLQAALTWFSARGWPLHGVVPSVRGVGPGFAAALRLMPLDYALVGAELQLLSLGESVPVSGIGPRCGGLWPRALARVREQLPGALGLARAPVLRLDLQPADAEPGRRLRWQRCLARQRRRREILTLTACARGWHRLAPARPAEPAEDLPVVSAEALVLPDSAGPDDLPPDWAGPAATPRHAADHARPGGA